MTEWFTRPVLHVKDVSASVAFYVERLGFTKAWTHDEGKHVVVAQVDRQGCALILSSQWPDKIGKGLVFVSLNTTENTSSAQIAALDALRAELKANGAAVEEGEWGYRLVIITDPDGNQLYFNYPND
ncbi:MAG TPA: glyoxalase superfamily protein [Kofleriaceae bacterium]